MPDKKSSSRPSRSVTLKDVAREAGVSVATVSHVVNGKARMGSEVKDRVLKVIAELGYQPNKAARSMKTGRSMTIGLVLPDLRFPYFPALAREIELVAASKDYSVVFANSYADGAQELKCVERMVQLGVDGIIWFPGSQQDTIAKAVKRTPVCVVDRDLGNYDVSMPDHEQGGRLQAQHLLRLGHKKFGIISGPRTADNMTLRVQGAIRAIEQSGQLMWECESGFQTLSDEAVRHLREQNVTAVIAGDDLIAINVCRQLESQGLNVPGDVSVVGFDNISWSEIHKPSLTTISIPLADMAKNALEMLLGRIANSDAARRRSILGVSLIERHSSAQS